jgi:hypothetical protein
MHASFVAGFVVGEGCFTRSLPGRFAFAVGLGAVDAELCHALHAFFRVGHLYQRARRKPHYDDEVTFTVQRIVDLVEVVVPFMDEHLPPSYKREQYQLWRAALLDHWEHRARRRRDRQCSVAGCAEPRRAGGYCRHHYYVLVEHPRRPRGPQQATVEGRPPAPPEATSYAHRVCDGLGGASCDTEGGDHAY